MLAGVAVSRFTVPYTKAKMKLQVSKIASDSHHRPGCSTQLGGQPQFNGDQLGELYGFQRHTER